MAPGIAASAFFAFLTSFDEIIIAMFLSTPAVATLPKRMWDAVRFEVDPTIAAISTLLVVLTVVPFVLTTPDPAVPAGAAPRVTVRGLAAVFRFSPRANPDFAWAFASRFMLVMAYAFLVTYQAY